MQIRGLGVIDEAVLELSPGFTVVTGETGAGKTMIVTGLGLLFGGSLGRGPGGSGRRPAIVEGRLPRPDRPAAAARCRRRGADLDDGACC